jgi:hypothetical protein
VKKIFTKIKKFSLRHRWSLALIALSLIVSGYVIWDNYSFQITESLPEINVSKKKEEEKVRAPFSGLKITKEAAETTPIAVIVENHPDARPQSGLNSADIVFETFAEGGITRFLAVYHSQTPPKEIGPIRSARPYFVEWAKSMEAYFAHVGGSIDALDLISKLRVYDINQFNFGAYFWRDRTRYAPHNVYSTLEKIKTAAATKKYPEQNSSLSGYKFTDDPGVEARPAAFSFRVLFNSSYGVTYSYSPEDNYFYRSVAGRKHTDRSTGEQLKAKNVLIGFSEFTYGRTRYNEQKVDIRTTGSGKAVAYINGQRNEGSWKRASGDIVRFYNASGEEFVLSPGTTWIDFVPTGTSVN